MEKRENAVDLLKLFFAVCVLMLHTNFAKLFSEKTEWYLTGMVLRISVPYFFIASGYFFGKRFFLVQADLKKRLSVCRRYVSHNLTAFLFWSLLSLALLGMDLVKERIPADQIVLRLVRQELFYPRGAMWFVLACMVAVMIIGLLWSKKRILISLAVACYVFALLCNTYYYIVSDTWFAPVVDKYMEVFISPRNGLGVGVLYIGLGMWLNSDMCPITKMKNTGLIVSTVICYVLLFVEVSLSYQKPYMDDHSLYISMPILTCGLFAISQRISVPISHEQSLACRRLSIYLYYLHPPINTVYGALKKMLHIPMHAALGVFVCCIGLWVMTKNSKNKYVRTVLP